MQPVKMSDETRCPGKPINWDEETMGTCVSLSITDRDMNGANVMISAWQPSSEELEKLNRGGFVYLGIYGVQHPVVFVQAEDH